LNLPKDNRITFQVHGMPVDELQLPTLIVDCPAHRRPSILRLVTVIATPSNLSHDTGEEIQRRIVTALQARDPNVSSFQLEPSEVISGDFTRQDVYGELVRLSLIMNSRRERPANDVLVMYYQGLETSRNGGDFALSTGNPRISIERKLLVDWFEELPGAHLLLLDVESSVPGQAADQSQAEDERLGLMRVAWLRDREQNRDPLLLVSALENVWTKSQTAELSLRSAAERMEQWFAGLKQDSSEIQFTHFIPEELQQLVIAP
jgi:hypothetical protein